MPRECRRMQLSSNEQFNYIHTHKPSASSVHCSISYAKTACLSWGVHFHSLHLLSLFVSINFKQFSSPYWSNFVFGLRVLAHSIFIVRCKLKHNCILRASSICVAVWIWTKIQINYHLTVVIRIDFRPSKWRESPKTIFLTSVLSLACEHLNLCNLTTCWMNDWCIPSYPHHLPLSHHPLIPTHTWNTLQCSYVAWVNCKQRFTAFHTSC